MIAKLKQDEIELTRKACDDHCLPEYTIYAIIYREVVIYHKKNIL